MRTLAAVAWLAWLAWLAWTVLGCAAGVDADGGHDALLAVSGGTFRRGAFPAENGGPAVLAAYLGRAEVRSGEQQKSFSGVLERPASAVALALAGDRGFWTVAAGSPFPETPESPSFNAPLSFASEVPLGERLLFTWAVAERERFGPPIATALRFVSAPGADGALVVSLGWDAASDLDLLVTTPSGVEIDKDNTSSSTGTPRPGESVGRLDFDSNADCTIDGRNRENIAWAESPPSGRYAVRVATASLCGEAVARYRVEVRLFGERLAAAEGTSTRAATRLPDGHGAGVLALEFDVP